MQTDASGHKVRAGSTKVYRYAWAHEEHWEVSWLIDEFSALQSTTNSCRPMSR